MSDNSIQLDRKRVTDAIVKYKHLSGYHANEWNRFIITTPDYSAATLVAASLGWWLNCWQWKYTKEESLIIFDTASI